MQSSSDNLGSHSENLGSHSENLGSHEKPSFLGLCVEPLAILSFMVNRKGQKETLSFVQIPNEWHRLIKIKSVHADMQTL